MSCHVWINLVLSDIIDYAERNDLAEVGETLRQTAARVAPLLTQADAAAPRAGGFDLFPVDIRHAVAGRAPGHAPKRGAVRALRRVV